LEAKTETGGDGSLRPGQPVQQLRLAQLFEGEQFGCQYESPRQLSRQCRDLQLLKRERIKRKIYNTRQDARSDVFDYIEMFYNAKRRHGFNNRLSPVEFEKRYAMSLQGV